MVELIQSFYNKNNKFKLIEFPEIFYYFHYFMLIYLALWPRLGQGPPNLNIDTKIS